MGGRNKGDPSSNKWGTGRELWSGNGAEQKELHSRSFYSSFKWCNHSKKAVHFQQELGVGSVK